MTNKETTNILIAGVGGQGILLASEVIASVCLTAGYDVKQSEVHGMAQRGGSVTSHVRFGKTVYSPTIEKGKADILLSFELLETLRWIDYLSTDGTVIVNTLRIDPMTVAGGSAQYPDNIPQELQSRCRQLVAVNGSELALQAGNGKAVNITLLGVLSRFLEFSPELWKNAIAARVPQKTIPINLLAFDYGRNAK
ncbi:MAG TPA: indolepyruvate oxidoreductase subunit beta [bacterium]|nr:indolepyruvate oxidoreductase subunit beta [bacterium]HPN44042.1 indolepyruvate oxidoreductase subunit beta [bacterium]